LLSIELDQVWIPWLRRTAEGLGVKRPLKYIYRKLRGDPVALAAVSHGASPP
jgi:hypothetical protein